jgi:hypothetical protein
MRPIVQEHDGIAVVRDDLFAGGTKARYLPKLFDEVGEVVYASPQEGGAQTSLAFVAQQLGKRATIFVAKRETPHPRVLMAKKFGATIVQVEPGYLNVVQKRAEDYCAATGARLAPFGMKVPGASVAIAEAARSTRELPDEVWCAGGSGVLASGLKMAWPNARLCIVEVGRAVAAVGAEIFVYPKPFGHRARQQPPFPSDWHYDAKAWDVCMQKRAREGRVLFWNVLGPA